MYILLLVDFFSAKIYLLYRLAESNLIPAVISAII